MKVRWTVLARLMVLIVVGLVSLGNITPQAAYASQGNTAQLRVAMFVCDERITPDLQPFDKNCFPSPVTNIKTVTGINQNGKEETWDAAKHICESAGFHGGSQISNWWWRFDKGVTITFTNGEQIKVNARTDKQWVKVNVRFVYLNLAGVRSSGYKIEWTTTPQDK